MIRSKELFEEIREPKLIISEGFLIDKSEQIKFVERNGTN